MDGQRFDGLTRELAQETSRRRVLRLAGGGLGAALLAALGAGKGARAQEGQGPPQWNHCISGGHTNPNDPEGAAKGCPKCKEGESCIPVFIPAGKFVCRCA